MTIESVFLNESRVDLDGSPRCLRLLRAHGLADELVPGVLEAGEALELSFDGDRLVAARRWEEGVEVECPVPDGARAIRPADVPRRSPRRLVASREPTGSRVGGRAPAGFVPPAPDHVAPFQYLATLTPALAGLEWLPFDLHLSAPTLNGYVDLYVDHRDPLRPVLLQEERSELGDFDFVDDVLTLDRVRDMRLEFRELHLSSVATDRWRRDSGTAGHVGVPHWLEDPWLPVCPSSGEPMRFVCEFGFDLFVDVVGCSALPVELLEERMRSAFAMARAGTLYAFLEPGSGIGCTVFQMG